MISLKPKHLKRYADLIRLIRKYGRKELMDQTTLQSVMPNVDIDWEDNLKGQPEQLADDLEKLGPTFIKLGQMLSTRSDLLSQPYLDALTRLQDDVEPMAWEQVEQVITDELKVKISLAFDSFDHQPLAAASLGQVHVARLRTGREVAVKIQRPDIRGVIMDDLEAFAEIARFLDEHTEFGQRIGISRLVKSLQRSLVAELDYRREANNCKSLRHQLQNFPRLIVPTIVEDYSTSKVLTMEYISGTKITDLSPVVLIELDREGLADELFRGYLHQVLVDGVFHADPHPGNVLLTRDHRIALLDLGMVARIGSEMQENLLKLLLDISEGRGDEAARVALMMGEEGKYAEPEKFRADISRMVAETQHARADQIAAGAVIMHIQRIAGDNNIYIPDDLVMLGKTLLNLDRIVAVLSPEFDPNAAMRRAATEVVQDRMRGRLSLGTVYHTLLEANALIQELPERLNKFTRMVADNELRVHVDAINEDKLIEGIQKVANRITAGLVVAALIVGASLIMRVDTDFEVLGYPVISLIFFVVAALAGVYLVVRSIFKDIKLSRRDRQS